MRIVGITAVDILSPAPESRIRTIHAMSSPSDNRYTDSHEWFRTQGDIVTMGITQYAVDELTDITYVEMQEVGSTVDSGDALGEIESVKATSDVYSPISGEIIEVNGQLGDDPSLVNTDPYGEGWLLKIRVSDASALSALMDSDAYDAKYTLA